MNFTETCKVTDSMHHVNIEYYEEDLMLQSIDDSFGDTLLIQISDQIDHKIWSGLYDKLEAMGVI